MNRKKLISLTLALVLCFAVSAGVAQESAADEMFGTINGSRYENPMMGLGCVLDGWSYSSQEEILAQYNKTRDAGSDKLKEIFESNTSVIVLFAESADRKTNVNIRMIN